MLDDYRVLNRSRPGEAGRVGVGVASCIAGHSGGEGEGDGGGNGGRGRRRNGGDTLLRGGRGTRGSLWRWKETFAMTGP